MNEVINDFFRLGSLRLCARVLMGLRGLYIVTHLDPVTLGDYTVWLLFVFYSTFLDGGVILGLERDLPHFRGSGETEMHQRITDIGLSTYFLLNGVASMALVAASLIFLKGPLLSIFLGLYLFTDKIYRAFDVNARVHFKYRENGIAELITAIISFLLIVFLMPRLGAHYIFFGFIVAAIVGAVYLKRSCPLSFDWIMNWREARNYVRTSMPLLMMASLMEIFQMVALTVLALRWDRQTLGFFAFAFRISQILLSSFPVLFQDVVRARMYFLLSRAKSQLKWLNQMMFPIGMYCLLASVIWITVYWWTDWVIWRFVKYYIPSVNTVKLLVMAMLPLGIVKICSDYLCSRVHLRARFVITGWFTGIVIQVAFLFILPMNPENFLIHIPVIYLGALLWVYFIITGTAFSLGGSFVAGLGQSFILILPMAVAIGVVGIVSRITGWIPLGHFQVNTLPYLTSLVFFVSFFCIFLRFFLHHPVIKIFYPIPSET